MPAQHAGGAALVAVVAVQDLLDEALLELAHGFIEIDAALDELVHQGFQLIFHGCLPTLRPEPIQAAGLLSSLPVRRL
jgi:hypothetical protein